MNGSRRAAAGLALGTGLLLCLVRNWDEWAEKRVVVVEPGRLVRGAWQRPGPLRRLIEREKIRTIVTLTAINRDDPKFVSQAQVVRETGVRWVIVPMRGSRATLEQMAEAADLLADTKQQPVFFHCVAGHHRTSLVHAAYRMRHQGWSAERAWRELAALAWTRPQTDAGDQRLIAAFAKGPASSVCPGKEAYDAIKADPKVDRGDDRRGGLDGGRLRGLEAGLGEFRDGKARARLPLSADGRNVAEPGAS